MISQTLPKVGIFREKKQNHPLKRVSFLPDVSQLRSHKKRCMFVHVSDRKIFPANCTKFAVEYDKRSKNFPNIHNLGFF